MGNVCSVNCNADGFYTRLVNGEFFKNKKGVNMFTGIILIWILIKLQAPTLLFWLAGVKMTWSVFEILLFVYKTGKES